MPLTPPDLEEFVYMNLVNGEIGEGLTPEEIRTFAARLGIEQKVF